MNLKTKRLSILDVFPCRNTKASLGERAFSLAEVMVGMVIMLFALIATYTGIVAGFQTIQLTREDLRATQLMIEKLESVRLTSWDQLSYIPTNSFTEYFYPLGGSKGTPFSTKVELSTYPYATPYASDMKQVTVTVTWTNGLDFSSANSAPVVRVRSMKTYIAHNGLQSYIFRYQ